MANQTRVSKVDLVDTLSHSPETTRRRVLNFCGTKNNHHQIQTIFFFAEYVILVMPLKGQPARHIVTRPPFVWVHVQGLETRGGCKDCKS